MGFFSNILMAILSLVNPILGFIGCAIKYIISEAKNAGFVFLVDIVGNFLPGGFAKDLAAGMVSDALEAGSVSMAADQIVPFNNIILRCERCEGNSHYYVRKEGLITCKDCFRNNIESTYVKTDRLFIFKNNISTVKNEITTFTSQSLSEKYTNFNNSFTPPSLSNKYKNYKN